MSLTLKQILTMHEDAYNHGYDTRLKAADDMLFAWVTQWDDTYLEQSDLAYRGEFNILRKAMRRILADLTANNVQVDFEPIDETVDNAADIMDGMYRSDMRNNVCQEAKKNGNQEAVVCGYGAWELRNEYKTTRMGDERQVIRRYPLYEANNNIMWDPNAKLIDKSDANFVSCLIPYSPEGYLDLKEELTGERGEIIAANFAYPEQSYVFPWISEDEKVYITRFFHREKRKVKYLTFEDEFGQEEFIEADDFDDKEDSLVERGFNLVGEKDITRYVVTRYIASGEEILEEIIIPGEHIPVIPQYGERAFVEGEEHYEGITRLAKDPQRLRNFQLSYLADITSRSPREKPIFTQEQIGGFEDQYNISGADNNLAYLLQHSFDANGRELPVGPVGYIKAPEVPPSLMLSIEQTRAAVDDVAGESLPADMTDIDLSGKAINALNKRLDMQSFTYQDNHKYALRRDGEVYASMARDIKDIEEEVTLIKVDGSRATETINKPEFNMELLQMEITNSVPDMAFDVYADIGPSFESVKQENKEELRELLGSERLDPETHAMLLNEYLTMIDGSAFKDIRDYSRKKLILMGVKQPETDEEIAMVQAAQAQPQQPDAMTIAAMAEMEKAKADNIDAQTKQMGAQVDMYNAETNRQKVQIQAAEAGVKIENTEADTAGKRIDNVMKLRQPVNPL